VRTNPESGIGSAIEATTHATRLNSPHAPTNHSAIGAPLIGITLSIRLVDMDALVVARNAIFLAMFERAADQLELDVYCDRDDDYFDLHVDELSVDLAGQLFDRWIACKSS
jgi:hypothetical protein